MALHLVLALVRVEVQGMVVVGDLDAAVGALGGAEQRVLDARSGDGVPGGEHWWPCIGTCVVARGLRRRLDVEEVDRLPGRVEQHRPELAVRSHDSGASLGGLIRRGWCRLVGLLIRRGGGRGWFVRLRTGVVAARRQQGQEQHRSAVSDQHACQFATGLRWWRARMATMGVDVEVETTIGRPTAVVAAFAGDPTNATEWYANIKSVDWQTPPPVAVGSRMDFVAPPTARSRWRPPTPGNRQERVGPG